MEGCPMGNFKGKGVVMAGLAVGAASLLSKKENREKAIQCLNDGLLKASSFVDVQMETLKGMKNGHEPNGEILADAAEGAADSTHQTIRANSMLDEGAQTTVGYYNEKEQ